MTKVALLGSSGFVGKAIARGLGECGYAIVPIHAPRLVGRWGQSPRGDEYAKMIARLRAGIDGCSMVINAAGAATPNDPASPHLMGANVMLPWVVAKAVEESEAHRLVHISSAAVQGDATLDESLNYRPLTAYAQSKVWGESAVLNSSTKATVLRPTSVHGPSRGTSKKLATFASSPLACVPASTERPTPQVLIDDVVRAVQLIIGAEAPPQVILQPWSGMTTTRLLELLGGRSPRSIPSPLARSVIKATRCAPSTIATALGRRLEILWFGQEQVDGWLTQQHPDVWQMCPDKWTSLRSNLMVGQ